MNVWVIAIPVGFLIGSIPFGFLIARFKGVDIRQHGSGNIGATNVGRVLGRRLGALCFTLDVLKGLVPTLGVGLVVGVAGRFDVVGVDAWLWLGAMTAPVLGHMFSPWIGFKGGKGVATGLGSLIGVFPILTYPALGAVVVWIIATAIWRYVSLASCIAAVAIPSLVVAEFAALGRMDSAVPFLAATGAIALLVIARHRPNLVRLIRGQERKIGQRDDPG